MDLAASIQKVTEEVMLRMARFVQKQTGTKNLCLAGGVALNCVGNGRVLREGPFENVWIQPAAGDAGGALGAALFVWHQLLDHPRTVGKTDSQYGSLLGPRYSSEEIRSFLETEGAVAHEYSTDDELCDSVAGLLATENVVGWFQGRMEFGPRALGGRSILGDARSREMQSTMNLKIKFRESFRPFAPSVLAERSTEYFDIKSTDESPYMLIVAPVQESQRLATDAAADALKGVEKLKVPRSQVPAITHVDYSARVQTVDERHGRYRTLLEKFDEKTGCPMLINTSFNVRGEPIVCTPSDAYRCFLATNMDVLVLENFVLIKKEQVDVPEIDVEAYLSQFQLD